MSDAAHMAKFVLFSIAEIYLVGLIGVLIGFLVSLFYTCILPNHLASFWACLVLTLIPSIFWVIYLIQSGYWSIAFLEFIVYAFSPITFLHFSI